MTFPSSWTKKPVYCDYADTLGAVPAGEIVSFVSRQVVVVGGTVVVPKKQDAVIAADGSLMIMLPATDDPVLSLGAGFAYTVYERFVGGRPPYFIFVAFDGTGVNLATAAPVVAPPLMGALSAYNLTIGTVTQGSTPAATITGNIPNQQLNLTLPAGGGGGGGGGGGAVDSVFGRTGAVTSQAGDYTFEQIGSKPTTRVGYGIMDAASSAQGAKADSAVQPGALSTVATTGAYNDLSGRPTLFDGAYASLSGRPTLGTAAATASTAYATAAQGTEADSALQGISAGTNVTIDNTDPRRPVVNASGGSNVLVSFAVDPSTGHLLETSTGGTPPFTFAIDANGHLGVTA